jgi:glycosyltransferase involved in cell wall biosynthesis
VPTFRRRSAPLATEAGIECLPLAVSAPIDAAAAVIIPVGPGKDAVLDTLESIACYCPEPHVVIIVDDCTQDGTYDALVSARRPNWHIFRNARPMGIDRLVRTLCTGYRFALSETSCRLILRLDQDALIIKPGVITEALRYADSNPPVGLFGVYERDYNRPRSFEAHRKLIDRELSWSMRLLGPKPSWAPLLALAERQGYRRGDNVFGGAYFVTRECLAEMQKLGALSVPYRWHSRLMEDVYFSMAAVAAGYKLGHFAAPEGPLCLEWRGLPYPARVMAQTSYKVIHSVDKGENTQAELNGGMSPRDIFKAMRDASLGGAK